MNALGKRSSSGPHAPLGVISRRRRAFTLTELLVVIAIIAVLASLVSVAVMRALDTAKQTRIKAEVDQLDLAMKAYKEKYGSYPPCDWRGLSGPLVAHIARAFPRYPIGNLTNDLKVAIPDFASFRPDQALVFWLSGFSPDPQNPFVTPDGIQIVNGMKTNAVNRTAFFDFDKTRLQAVSSATNPLPSYFPPGGKIGASGAPYVYWSSGTYGGPPTSGNPDPPTSPQRRITFNDNKPSEGIFFQGAGTCRPYALDANVRGGASATTGNGVFDNDAEDWANPDSFQIISAGLDGKYGDPNATGVEAARMYPTGTRYDVNSADDDNVTNFCPKARLGDAKP